VGTGEAVVAAADDEEAGLRADTGRDRWRRSYDTPVEGLAATGEGVVATGNGLAAVAPRAGTERWRIGVGNELELAVGDGATYGLSYDTPVIAFDPESGDVLWRHGGFEGTTSPVLAGEYLFVGDGSGRVRAIGPEPE
jgi:hypothetical protein